MIFHPDVYLSNIYFVEYNAPPPTEVASPGPTVEVAPEASLENPICLLMQFTFISTSELITTLFLLELISERIYL